MDTNCGAIEIRLDVKRAAKTTASFAYLVRRGFYNDLTFHRVVRGFVIQGGDPLGNGTGGPGYRIVEPPPARVRYSRGVVAMAKTNAAPSGTSGSQFFIVTGSNVELPPLYALVGHVVGSYRAVEAIASFPTKEDPGHEHSRPIEPIVISRAVLSVRP
jgi:peptidyl-prolyl cis-trans isomerase B (cyclophilin B)